MDNPNGQRLLLSEMQEYDLEHDESEVRLLEMLVDSGSRDPRLSMQFWRDVEMYGIREAYVYLKGYAEQGLWAGDLAQVKEQVNKLLLRHGRTRTFGFSENPWLVAGPHVEIRRDMAPSDQAAPSRGAAFPALPAPRDGGNGHVPGIPISEEAPSVAEQTPTRILPSTEVERRRRQAVRQKRTRGGRFKNNPPIMDRWDGMTSRQRRESLLISSIPEGTARAYSHKMWEELTPGIRSALASKWQENPYPAAPAEQVKVYEVERRGKTHAGFFKYDSSRQVATVKAVEREGTLERVVEIDVMADMAEARHMYEMLRRRGMGYFVRKVAKSGLIRAKRRYEHTAEVTPVPAREVPMEMEPPVSPREHIVTQNERVRHAMTLTDQVRHEVEERDFAGALESLMKIHQLVIETMTRGETGIMGLISSQWERAKSLVEGAWPGRVRFK